MRNPSYNRYRRQAARSAQAHAAQQAAQIAFYRANIARENSSGCIRMGTIPTNIPIAPGVPDPLGSLMGQMPDPIATARTNGLALENISALGGLALENGIGEQWAEMSTTGKVAAIAAGAVVASGVLAWMGYSQGETINDLWATVGL